MNLFSDLFSKPRKGTRRKPYLFNTDPAAGDGGGGGGGAGAAVANPPAGDAAAKAAADKAAADKAVADKAAADKATADAAAAEKAKADQAAALKSALKLPDNAAIDPAITERIAATASARGLTPEQAQAVLDVAIQEATSHGTKAVDAFKSAFEPGGAEWQKQQEGFKTAALADPELGGGKPEQLEANTGLAKRVLATLFKDTPDKVAAMEKSALFTNPEALRLLVRVGKSMKEDQMVPPPGAGTGAKSEQDRLERMYPSMKKTS